MIYTDFESISVPEDNGKQNPDESYLLNIKSHAACSYACKLIWVGDKFSKSFRSYLGEDVVYDFTYSMIEERKYCSNVMKKHYNKELVKSKEDKEDFENPTKCWVCDNVYVDGDIIERGHCQRGYAQRDLKINVRLNHKILIVFHNLKKIWQIKQELGKLNLRINVMPNR